MKKMSPEHYHKKENKEIGKITWEQFREATEVFSGDLGIVNHTDTPIISPFGLTNGKDSNNNRQYNLTQIPPDMTEEQFITELKKRRSIKIGCMDKDASGPEFQNLSAEEKKQRAHFLMAGGAVQVSEDRFNALKTMIQYLGDPEKTGHIDEVYFTGHDNVCGYVKFELNRTGLAPGQSLPEIFDSKPGAHSENTGMKNLIRFSAQETGASEIFGERLICGVEVIDREGGIKTDTDFDNIEPKSLDQIVQENR